MDAVYRATGLAVCLALMACGNKGNLYIEEIELSEEQKAVLDNATTKKPKKKKSDTPQTVE